ncbi:hypothetical protein AB0B89_36390 [Sphaerisporangium sp. NPDC049002]|uniref:hypothetical protein n=1 Tax=Sphaerisporangium sp. NPDC049002 TaxID=3155392 RepID=UPI0033F229DF
MLSEPGASKEISPEQIDQLMAALHALKNQLGLLQQIEVAGEDDRVIDAAFEALRVIKSGRNASREFTSILVTFRNDIIAAIVKARPGIKMADIASEAGIDDSLATRVSRQRGAKPRTYRAGGGRLQ